MLETMKETSFQGKKVVISGSGNVAMYALQKVVELGGTVVAMSDSAGYIYNEDGIDFNTIKEIKLTNRLRISEYLKYYPNTTYVANSKDIWGVKCDIALPCATQNEIDIEAAQKLVENNVMAVAEGANMPCTLEATNYFIENKVLYGPAKAANAGGVLVSGLEMSQNSMRYSWTFEEVDAKLHQIMKNIYKNCSCAADEYGLCKNLVAGANIAGFLKVAEAMKAQGVV
jgi:glutamate dehydrogenase (NADP+)